MSPKNGSNLSINIVIPYIWIQINFCSYVGITYYLPVIHKQVFFFLIKYFKISNLVWIDMCHQKIALNCMTPPGWGWNYVFISNNHRMFQVPFKSMLLHHDMAGSRHQMLFFCWLLILWWQILHLYFCDTFYHTVTTPVEVMSIFHHFGFCKYIIVEKTKF